MKRAVLVSLIALGAVATSAMAEDWHIYSRSQTSIFMAEVDSIRTAGDVTSMLVGRAPRQGDAGDYSHTTEMYEFRCTPKQWRTAGQIEYGPDGAELERYPEEGAAWEPTRANSIPDQLREIACEGARANPPSWPNVKAWVDAGRP